jgi:hypothetical protein
MASFSMHTTTTVRVLAATLLLTTLGACRGSEAADPATYTPIATVDQVMDAIVVPSSDAVFDAVVYENGALVQAPKTDDDWFRLQMHALAVAEAGNLLMMPPRAKDTGEWDMFAHAMVTSGAAVAKAAESKDVEGLLETGGELYRACAGCHEKYLPKE